MRRTARAAAALLTVLVLAGCTSTGGTGSSAGNSIGAVSPQSGAASTGKADSSAPFAAPDIAGNKQVSGRDVITTGSVSITAHDPIRAAHDAVTITEQADGRIDNRTENPGTDSQPASASLTLRIPTSALDHTLAELKKLGTVNNVSLSSADVTQQTVDLDARITALHTSVDRLLGLMSKATTTADLIAIESALSERQSELEGLTAQRAFLADQIEYSTITLDLTAEGVLAPGSPTDFWGAIAAGWTALVAAGAGLLVALGYALPWLIVIGVVTVIVLLSVRGVRRRRHGKQPESTPESTPTPPGSPVS